METLYMTSHTTDTNATLDTYYATVDSTWYIRTLATNTVENLAALDFITIGFLGAAHPTHEEAKKATTEEKPHVVPFTEEDLTHAIARLCLLNTIELSEDGGTITDYLTKAGKVIATNLYSEDPHEWEALETEALNKAGWNGLIRVSDYHPVTKRAYVLSNSLLEHANRYSGKDTKKLYIVSKHDTVDAAMNEWFAAYNETFLRKAIATRGIASVAQQEMNNWVDQYTGDGVYLDAATAKSVARFDYEGSAHVHAVTPAVMAATIRSFVGEW